MSNFSNYKKFENVGIRSSNDTLIVMDSSNNNISLHSSDGGDDNVDTLSIKNIINKTPNMDLNLSSLNGNVINPVITINNNNGDCRIMTNLNVNGNINCTNDTIIHKNLNVNGNVNLNNDTIIGNGTINTSLGEISRGAVPIKAIIMWSGTEAEAQDLVGWALCTGGTQNGITIPDLRDRFIVGAGSAYTTGNTGGANTVSLSVSNIPSHNHTVSIGDHHHSHSGTTAGGGSHSHTFHVSSSATGAGHGSHKTMRAAGYHGLGASSTSSESNHTHTFSTNGIWHSHSASAGYTGSGSAHENRPPYYALAYIIRIQ